MAQVERICGNNPLETLEWTALFETKCISKSLSSSIINLEVHKLRMPSKQPDHRSLGRKASILRIR